MNLTRPAPEFPLIVCLQLGTTAPLFFVPGQRDVGDGFQHIARDLGPEQTVYSFTYEFWETNREVYHSLAEIAALFVAEIRRIQPAGPYRVAGFCLGGTISFEVTRQLLAAGYEVIQPLVLIDTLGPSHSPEANMSRGERLWQLAWFFRHQSAVTAVRLAGRRLAGVLGGVARRVRRKPKAPDFVPRPGVVEARWSYLNGVYRARPIASAIHVIRAAIQPEWFQRLGGDAPDLGWAGFGMKGVTTTTLPGERDDQFVDPGAAAVAAEMLRVWHSADRPEPALPKA